MLYLERGNPKESAHMNMMRIAVEGVIEIGPRMLGTFREQFTQSWQQDKGKRRIIVRKLNIYPTFWYINYVYWCLLECAWQKTVKVG